MNTHHRTIDTSSSGPSTADFDLFGKDRAQARGPTSRSILVAVSGGPSGWSALDWAASEASVRHCALRIMHAVAWPRWGFNALGEVALDWHNTNAPERGSLVLEAAARRARLAAPGSTITTHLEAGEPAGIILKASRNDALIVIGHGSRRVPGRRTVAAAVERRAHCPIAIVCTTPAANEPNGERR